MGYLPIHLLVGAWCRYKQSMEEIASRRSVKLLPSVESSVIVKHNEHTYLLGLYVLVLVGQGKMMNQVFQEEGELDSLSVFVFLMFKMLQFDDVSVNFSMLQLLIKVSTFLA